MLKSISNELEQAIRRKNNLHFHVVVVSCFIKEWTLEFLLWMWLGVGDANSGQSWSTESGPLWREEAGLCLDLRGWGGHIGSFGPITFLMLVFSSFGPFIALFQPSHDYCILSSLNVLLFWVCNSWSKTNHNSNNNDNNNNNNNMVIP